MNIVLWTQILSLQNCEEDVRSFAFKAIVLRMSSSLALPGLVTLVKFRQLLYRLWALSTSLAWFLVFIQRKRRRSLTVGSGSGVSACPPAVTAAWGHVRAPALELSANKPPRLRSVRFPATGRSNLEVSIALLRGLLRFLFWVWSRKPVFLLSSADVLVKASVLYSGSPELEHAGYQKAASSELLCRQSL